MNFIKITEQPSIHEDLEQKSVRELLEGINEEDRKVASAVHACIPQIEKLVNEIVERMHQGCSILRVGRMAWWSVTFFRLTVRRVRGTTTLDC